jgi:hypothetical protein
MRLEQQSIKRQAISLEQITATFDEFDRVVQDMFAHAGEFMPTANWVTLDPGAPAHADAAALARQTYAVESFARRFSSLDKVLFSWIGEQGSKTAEPWLVRLHSVFHDGFDPLGLWKHNVADQIPGPTLNNADLSSILELSLIEAFAPARDPAVTTVLEIGGGYGRLAEAALNVFGDSVRYVLVDSVPASLLYAHKYLTRACPNRRIGSYYAGDRLDLSAFDCYIAPSWHFERLNPAKYDVCVNVDSFQEMSQPLVDRYLKLFDSVLQPDGIVYNSNGRGTYFSGSWNFPPHWRKAFCAGTPRPWFDNHPTEIFVNAADNFSKQNAALDAAHSFLYRAFRNPMATMQVVGTRQVLRAVAGKVRSKLRGT